MSYLGIRPGAVVADFACGPGFFAPELIRPLEGRGMLYGIDANPVAIEMCEQRLRESGYTNFELRLEHIEDLDLPANTVDVGLIANALHDFRDPRKALGKVYESMTPGAVLGIVDWIKEETPVGPPVDIRLAQSEEEKLVDMAGFSVKSAFVAGPYHYLIIATK